MSSSLPSGETFEQYMARMVRASKRALAQSSEPTDLALRLVIAKDLHAAACRYINGLQRSAAQDRALADEALRVVKLADKAGAVAELAHRLKIERAKEAQTRQERARQAQERQALARKAIEARHDQPGGNRAKRDAVRAEWLTGQYSSRARCAEVMAPKLGITVDTARKHLAGMVDPHKAAR